MAQQTVQQRIAFSTFCNDIDKDSVTRTFDLFGKLTQQGFTAIHLLFQSGGGCTPEGIALYSYFKTFPIDLHLYNVGGVASAALTAFAGAKYRYASTHATFLFHKATAAVDDTPKTAAEYRALAETLMIDEDRIKAILKAAAPNMPQEKWNAYETTHATITAQEACQYGLIMEIREFAPPAGTRFFDI